MTREEKAAQFHKNGYSCSQAVLCAFQDVTGLDEATLCKIAEGFSSGMGNMEGPCGALTGAIMAGGLMKSDGLNSRDSATKRDNCKLAGKIAERFREEAGSTICKEIKGVDTGKVLCSCHNCVKIGARIASEMLE